MKKYKFHEPYLKWVKWVLNGTQVFKKILIDIVKLKINISWNTTELKIQLLYLFQHCVPFPNNCLKYNGCYACISF